MHSFELYILWKLCTYYKVHCNPPPAFLKVFTLTGVHRYMHTYNYIHTWCLICNTTMDLHWSVRSIVVLQIKHHLTSPPSSHLTQAYTVQRLEVQPNYIYHFLGLNFITQVLSFKVPRCLTIYQRLSESYRRGSYLEMPCLDIVEILTCRTSYCTIHRMEHYFHYF